MREAGVPATRTPSSTGTTSPTGPASRSGTTLRTAAAAARVARADFRALYTPVTWTVGWLGRVVTQVLFFALVGVLLEDRDALLFLFVGQAVMACAAEAFFAVQSTTWERRAGTLPLLVAAPGPLWPVFLGRSVQWVPSGVATSAMVLLAVGPLLGLSWTPTTALAALGCVVVVSLGSYASALALAALVLRAPGWRNVVANLAHTSLMLVAGVVVPVGYWPGPVQVLAQAFPLTHGLAAVRGVLEPQVGWGAVGGSVLAAAAATLAWFVVAVGAFTAFGGVGRRDGSIDFAD
nr:ABC transporter permease [uncultured Actinotalea sp.]